MEISSGRLYPSNHAGPNLLDLTIYIIQEFVFRARQLDSVAHAVG